MNLKWMRIIGLTNMLLAIFCVLPAAPTHAKGFFSSDEAMPVEIALSSLPVEAIKTLRLIKAGGPYPYSRDGLVFGNYEKRLPKKQRGYYREYTVKTPGARNRGARRIVCGPPTECYYTGDHYKSFNRIRE